MSTYYPNIPQSTDNPSTSQGQILTNFGTLNTVFAIDHVPFSPTAATQGQHKQVTFTAVLGSDPSLSAGQGALYTKTVNALTELFYEKTDGGSVVTQLTSGTASYVAGSGNFQFNGQSYLPGGFEVKFGRVQIAGTTGTVRYSTDCGLNVFPNRTLNVQMLPFLNSTTNVNITSVSASQFTFTVNGTPGSLVYYWYAIGN